MLSFNENYNRTADRYLDAKLRFQIKTEESTDFCSLRNICFTNAYNKDIFSSLENFIVLLCSRDYSMNYYAYFED